MPGCVPKGEHIISHDDLEGINKGGDWDAVREEFFVGAEVGAGDAVKSFVGVNVGVH